MNDVSRRTFLKTGAAIAVAAAAETAEGEENAMSGFMAGVAVRDITPPTGVPMWGYSDRPGPSTGTLDPLMGRALVLRAGDTTTAIVTMDLGRVPKPPVLDRIRERARRAGVQHVDFTASHTHGGPVMEMSDAPHVQTIAERLGECIEDAVAGLKPVKIGIGPVFINVSHNRRIITEDGKCLMLWRNAERRPTSPVDHWATVIKLETESGSPLAAIVHYACHPVVLGPDNVEYTADYVGEMARIVKETTGAECLFLQGGAGDINPYLDKTPRNEGGVESMRSVGNECAVAVISAWNSISTETPAQPSLAWSEKMVEVGTRWDFTNPDQQTIFRTVYGRIFDAYLTDLQRDLSVPLSVLVINRDIALAFMPGELFVQYQLDLKVHAPVGHFTGKHGFGQGGFGREMAVISDHRKALLVGYSNDFHIYFPTVLGAAAGGYGGTTATYVGVGAGDKLVMEAAIEIGKLTNSIRPVCTLEDFQLVEAPKA
jgi:neutral ceramidase